jgi:hypothetical protein
LEPWLLDEEDKKAFPLKLAVVVEGIADIAVEDAAEDYYNYKKTYLYYSLSQQKAFEEEEEALAGASQSPWETTEAAEEVEKQWEAEALQRQIAAQEEDETKRALLLVVVEEVAWLSCVDAEAAAEDEEPADAD